MDMDSERARPPAPAGDRSHQDIIRIVFTSMAGRRLLPEEGWSLSRAIHDTAAPIVKVRLEAGGVPIAMAHHLLEDTARKLIVELTMEGDFTEIQARPLSLPPSLVQLELAGFRGELGPAPSGLRKLSLCAYCEDGDKIIPHPPLADINDGDAMQNLLQEMAELIRAVLPSLRVLQVEGLQEDLYDRIPCCAYVQALRQLPYPYLEEIIFLRCRVHSEDFLLLSPAVGKLKFEECFFESNDGSGSATVPSFPEGLISLEVRECWCDSGVMVFSSMPETLRHITIDMDQRHVGFEPPLPIHLEALHVSMRDCAVNINEGMLPAGLRVLDLSRCAHVQFNELPPSLRVLKLHKYEHPLPPLPDTLETLVLDECTGHIAQLPNSVRSLSLYWRPPRPAPPLPARWPAHLEHLTYWCKSANREAGSAPVPCIQRLPPTLRYLELNRCELRARLPNTLQELRLGRGFTDTVDFTGRVVVNSPR